jgi:hypothetical protein
LIFSILKVAQTNQEMKYDSVKGWLRGDDLVNDLSKNLKKTKIAADGLVERARSLLRQRQAEIVVQAEMGYYGINSLSRRRLEDEFPKGDSIWNPRDIEGVTVIDLKHKSLDYQKTVHYSRALGIWVIGEPDVREDGAYCQITGEKISE